MPRNTRRISPALGPRREESDAGLKNLEKMNQRTNCTDVVDYTEHFIKAQGWANKMEIIHNEFVHLQDGLENMP